MAVRKGLEITMPEGPFILTGVLGVKTAMVTCETFAPIIDGVPLLWVVGQS